MANDLVARPAFPTESEIRLAQSISNDGGRRLLEEYLDARSRHEHRLDKLIEEEIRAADHIRRYRYLSVLSGVFLATISIILCGFAIQNGKDIAPIALILTPVTALAGIFVWGYRPKEQKEHKTGSAAHGTELPTHQFDAAAQ